MSNLPNCIYHGPVTRVRTVPLRIDLQHVMTKKLGRGRMRFVPGVAIKAIERLICVSHINRILAQCHPKTGADFARGVLKALNIKVNVHNTENVPTSNRRVLFVSNHPMGGIEGMALIDFIQRMYGGQIHVVVNDILMALEPLQNVFVPVNKHGRQGVETARRMDEAMASDNPVLIFPAGWVSRLDSKGRVVDYKWYKSFVTKAIEHHRNIMPVYCDGRNSMFFYRFAKLREKLGIKLNIEMVRLPREVLLMRNKSMNIFCGRPIDWTALRGGRDAESTAYSIRQQVYALQP